MKPLPLIAALSCLAACGRSPRIDTSEAANSPEVNRVAASINETDGRDEIAQPLSPEEAGRRMRSAATEPPQPK